MSVVGFDIGNENGVVAVARQRGFDVVLNYESKRETPAIVSFGDKQRFIGTAGAARSMVHPTNTISQIKRLIGHKCSDPLFQKDIQSLPFDVTEGPNGFPLIHVSYLGKKKSFTPTQLLAMVLSDLKIIAEKNLNGPVKDCCIGIPVYFTDLQRREVLDAATIAGLHPLSLIHETTATALGYGIYKTDLTEKDPLNIAFVDVGHSSMQVSIVAFKKGELKVLAHSFDHSLGGRDFDEALFCHFASKFKEEYKIDVSPNPRACVRLRAACEKVKKVLSANAVAPLNIECLMEEKDLKGVIQRDEFEDICVPILKRVKGPLEKALSDAGLSVENIHSVEVVGSGSRVPAIIKILTEFFGKEPRRTMNASECVARGCALQCAILSPTSKVRHFEVRESFPFPIALSWKATAPNTETEVSENQQLSVVFTKGNQIPSDKSLLFFMSGTFTVDVVYADARELGAPPETISTYTIGPFQTSNGQRAKLEVLVRLNNHGIVSVESAATMLEEDGAEVLVKDAKMDVGEQRTNTSAAEGDVNMEDAKSGTEAEASEVENGAANSGDKNAPMETDTKTTKKKKIKTIIPKIESIYGGLPYVEKAKEKEFKMARQDRVMEETKDKKNAVEAYVYEMSNKLRDKYHDFETEPEMKEFIKTLETVESWLYEEGKDETKDVYVTKLEELKQKGDLMMNRLDNCISSNRKAALSKEPKFDHIDLADKQKVVKECTEAEAWPRERKYHQDSLPKHATPVLLSSDKPAPKPQTPPPPSPEADPQTPVEEQSEKEANDSQTPAPDTMDTDKPEAAS